MPVHGAVMPRRRARRGRQPSSAAVAPSTAALPALGRVASCWSGEPAGSRGSRACSAGGGGHVEVESFADLLAFAESLSAPASVAESQHCGAPPVGAAASDPAPPANRGPAERPLSAALRGSSLLRPLRTIVSVEFFDIGDDDDEDEAEDLQSSLSGELPAKLLACPKVAAGVGMALGISNAASLSAVHSLALPVWFVQHSSRPATAAADIQCTHRSKKLKKQVASTATLFRGVGRDGRDHKTADTDDVHSRPLTAPLSVGRAGVGGRDHKTADTDDVHSRPLTAPLPASPGDKLYDDVPIVRFEPILQYHGGDSEGSFGSDAAFGLGVLAAATARPPGARPASISRNGQFGVSLYSASLVSDKVRVIDRHTDDEQYVGESAATGAADAVAAADTGTGMSTDELFNNLGKSAKSDSKGSMEAVAAGGDISRNVQFGDSLHSASLVSDKVRVIGRHTDDKQHSRDSADSGIGMSSNELIKDLGKSAKWGTRNAMKEILTALDMNCPDKSCLVSIGIDRVG